MAPPNKTPTVPSPSKRQISALLHGVDFSDDFSQESSPIKKKVTNPYASRSRKVTPKKKSRSSHVSKKITPQNNSPIPVVKSPHNSKLVTPEKDTPNAFVPEVTPQSNDVTFLSVKSGTPKDDDSDASDDTDGSVKLGTPKNGDDDSSQDDDDDYVEEDLESVDNSSGISSDSNDNAEVPVDVQHPSIPSNCNDQAGWGQAMEVQIHNGGKNAEHLSNLAHIRESFHSQIWPAVPRDVEAHVQDTVRDDGIVEFGMGEAVNPFEGNLTPLVKQMFGDVLESLGIVKISSFADLLVDSPRGKGLTNAPVHIVFLARPAVNLKISSVNFLGKGNS